MTLELSRWGSFHDFNLHTNNFVKALLNTMIRATRCQQVLSTASSGFLLLAPFSALFFYILTEPPWEAWVQQTMISISHSDTSPLAKGDKYTCLANPQP